MRRALLLGAIVLLSVAGLASGLPSRGSRHQSEESRSCREAKQIIRFGTMYGVDGPFIGEAFAIRGIPGDELPWVIGSAQGSLDTDGHLTIRVRGLVFKDADPVPLGKRGINDETEFRGLVSCLTEQGDSIVTANVFTEGFPATRSGNSLIRTTVQLPNPCVAPILMVLAGSENKWFSVTGFESLEGG